MTTPPWLRALAALCAAVLATPPPAAAQLVRSAGGANPAAIQATVDTYRADLGALNANVAGIQNGGAGRREINWDAVPAAFSAPNNLPANFFNSNSPRGAQFTTAGTGFQVSGATSDAGAGQPAAANFGNINAGYTTTFQTFSPQRLFTQLGGTAMDVLFFVAGSANAATTRGFGAVFTDVDAANTTSIQYFDGAGGSLGTFFVPTSPSGGLSFLGVSFPTANVGRVRITNGNTALGAGVNDNGTTTELVVMDDFIYAEPVPEPGTLVLMGFAAAVGGWRLRRRRVADVG